MRKRTNENNILVMQPEFFIITLSGIWAFAISLRFIIDGFFNNHIYMVNTFDIFIDWIPLFLFGIFTFFYGFYLLFRIGKDKG